jgi:serine/threonine protein kinase/WD40 repeat protein
MAGRAQEVFENAVDLAGAEREAYIRGACGADQALRAEVEGLFRAYERGGGFLSSPTAAPGANAAAATLVASIREGPGTRIGPYKLLQLIGEGGFGSVFMAEQERPVARKVALKIIKLGMDTRQVIARFEAERQALALMDHPNIARVLDAGATEAGRPYFVMELCKGDAIVEYCDKNNLSIPERLELFAQVCRAVQHAHTKGIIHRDLKPSNILVSTQDGRPHAKVIDFGIAKATASRLTEKTLFTEHRALIGTPEYMSPEQAEGSLDIDTRTDVYSLGVLLYELLTGTTPFSGKELRSAAYAEIQRIIREVEPPKPSTRLSKSTETLASIAAQRHTEPRKLGSILRGDLDWIVMKALEKDRLRRYETANALAMDIGRYLAGRAVLAAPPSRLYQLQKFVRRYRAAVIAGLLVVTVLVLGVIGTTSGMLWALNEKGRADLAASSEALAKRKAQDNATAALAAADKAERAAYQAQMISAASDVEDKRMDGARALLAATPPQLRGWEYQHLASRLDRSLPSPLPADWRITRIRRAAESDVTAVLRLDKGRSSGWVVLSPDLRSERFKVGGAGDESDLVISPDGSRAVWMPPANRDVGPPALWNLETGTLITRFPIKGSQAFLSASWSPTGDRFMISRENRFDVYEGRTGSFIEGRDTTGYTVFTQDSRWILQNSVVDRHGWRLLDARTFEPRPEIFLEAKTPGPGWISFWRSRIAYPTPDGSLQVLEIVDGLLEPRFTISPGMGVLGLPVWSADGRLIAVASAEGRVGVWETDSQTPRGEFTGSQIGFTGMLFLPESGDLWACTNDGLHCVWPLSGATGGVLTAHKSYVYPVLLSKDGGLLLSGGWDGYFGHAGGLKVWDPRTGALLAEHGRANEIVWSIGLTPDGRHAVVGYHADQPSLQRTEVIDLWSGRVAQTFSPACDRDYPVCVVHPDGRRAITAYWHGGVCVWELLSGKVLWETSNRTRPVEASAGTPSSAVAVSPDGRLLALADGDKAIRLVDADSYADIRRWEAHTERVFSLSFSPDGTRLLSASLDDTVGVWDVATGALIARLVGHNADVFCAAMSPDGTRIASGGRDRIVRLWDTTHFENVGQLVGHRDYIYSLAWSADGRQLITGSGDSTVRIWDTRTLAEQVDATRARAEVMPAIEAKLAQARTGAESPVAAVEAVLASPNLGARERVLVRQAAVRFAFTRP